MNKTDIHIHAERVVKEYFEDGITFDWVVEDELLEEVSDEDLELIHTEADKIVRLFALAL